MKKRVGSILLGVILAVGIFNITIVQRANSQSATPTWDQYCMSCHGTAASFGPRTVAQIDTAIKTITSMKNDAKIKSIPVAQLPTIEQTISDELSGKTGDTTPPTVTAFTIPSTSTSLTVSITTFTATDNVAVTGYLITESTTKPSATATGWTATAPTSFTASAAGARTLYAWAKDAAGNVSASRSASVTITLPDTTPPNVTAFTIPSTSTSLTVSITTFTATDNVAVTGYLITESTTKPSATATGWTATAPTSFTASAAGARTLYAWAKDAAGNVSASRSASVTITLPDTTPPNVTAFTIPSTSTSLTVSITTFTATDNVAVTGYIVTESATAPSASAAGWTATAPTSFTASAAGARTLYAWAKDAAGNVSASRSASVTITLADTTPPNVTAFTIPSTSTSLTVSITTFTATDNVGVTGYIVTESATAPSASAAGWSATAPTSFTASAAGARTLYAWAKDAAGNVSASRSASVTITLSGGGSDTTPPAITSFRLPATSESLTVPINLTATDDVGVTGYLVKTNPRKPPKNSLLWKSTPPTSHTFRTPGAKTLYAWAKDAAGNISATSSATVTVSRSDEIRRPTRGEGGFTSATKSAATATGTTPAPAASATPPSTTSVNAGPTAADRIAPSIASFSVPANSVSLAVTISSFRAADNVRVTGYMVNESPVKPSPDDPNWRPSAPTSYRFTTAGTKTLYAWVKDAAGNVSASRTAVVRISLPAFTPASPRTNLKK